jgi:hypothetical protein
LKVKIARAGEVTLIVTVGRRSAVSRDDTLPARGRQPSYQVNVVVSIPTFPLAVVLAEVDMLIS